MLKRFLSISIEGTEFTKRVYLTNSNQKISPWHDIPLTTNPNKYHFPAVIEIPRHNISKFEVCLSEEFNPIKQDTRKNRYTSTKEIRHYARFPLFNYGMLPQTWESPHKKDAKLGLSGDNDPLDLLDLSSIPVTCGSLIEVKIIGGLCLVDQGEIDWKILSINANDPLAAKLNNPKDLELVFPHLTSSIIDWFEHIKVFDGKGKNRVELPLIGPDECLDLITECHNDYKLLLSANSKDMWVGNNNKS